MQLILNELSFPFPATTLSKGQLLMEDFIKTYQYAKKSGFNEQIILDRDFKSFELFNGYTIGKWLNDPSIDRELKAAFRSLLNKSLAFDKHNYKDTAFNIDLTQSQFSYNNQNAVGCLIAYETNNCVISFSYDNWKLKLIEGTYSTLDDIETLNFPLKVSVPNVFNQSSVQLLQSLALSSTSDKLKTGNCILSYQDDFFSNLIFCDNAKKQLNDLTDPIITRQVVKHLLDLQNYISTCNNKFDKTKLKNASPESKATLINYKRQHTFKLPDGSYYTFSWHLRYTGDADRIFFHPDTQNKLCYIAYIGHKLPTVMYPTP